MTKLIILRGNSGTGKSSTAKLLRDQAKTKTALIEQDYLRRTVLKEKEVEDGDNITLIKQTVEFAAVRNYNVILEGILAAKRYKPMLEELIDQFDEFYAYYFDISLEETLRRHENKPNADEFREKLRDWYVQGDTLGVVGEKVIDETYSQEKIVAMISSDTGL